MYFTIRCSEDGDITIEQHKHDGITRLINDKEENDFDTANFMDTIINKNPQYWKPNSILIIKGKIVTPKPIKIIEEYQIE